MVILKQERVLLYTVRGKFVSVWMLVSHELDGPSIHLFKDETCKKPVEEAVAVAKLGPSGLRFGTTSSVYSSPAARAQGLYAPLLGARDMRLDPACLVAIRTERVYQRIQRPYMIWLCCLSVEQLFDFVRVLASSLESVRIAAPEPNAIDDTNALHRYRPTGFEPDEGWESYWDNPPKGILQAPQPIMIGSISVDALNIQATGASTPTLTTMPSVPSTLGAVNTAPMARADKKKRKGLFAKRTQRSSSTPTLDIVASTAPVEPAEIAPRMVMPVEDFQKSVMRAPPPSTLSNVAVPPAPPPPPPVNLLPSPSSKKPQVLAIGQRTANAAPLTLKTLEEVIYQRGQRPPPPAETPPSTQQAVYLPYNRGITPPQLPKHSHPIAPGTSNNLYLPPPPDMETPPAPPSKPPLTCHYPEDLQMTPPTGPKRTSVSSSVYSSSFSYTTTGGGEGMEGNFKNAHHRHRSRHHHGEHQQRRKRRNVAASVSILYSNAGVQTGGSLRRDGQPGAVQGSQRPLPLIKVFGEEGFSSRSLSSRSSLSSAATDSSEQFNASVRKLRLEAEAPIEVEITGNDLTAPLDASLTPLSDGGNSQSSLTPPTPLVRKISALSISGQSSLTPATATIAAAAAAAAAQKAFMRKTQAELHVPTQGMGRESDSDNDSFDSAPETSIGQRAIAQLNHASDRISQF